MFLYVEHLKKINLGKSFVCGTFKKKLFRKIFFRKMHVIFAVIDNFFFSFIRF